MLESDSDHYHYSTQYHLVVTSNACEKSDSEHYHYSTQYHLVVRPKGREKSDSDHYHYLRQYHRVVTSKDREKSYSNYYHYLTQYHMVVRKLVRATWGLELSMEPSVDWTANLKYSWIELCLFGCLTETEVLITASFYCITSLDKAVPPRPSRWPKSWR